MQGFVLDHVGCFLDQQASTWAPSWYTKLYFVPFFLFVGDRVAPFRRSCVSLIFLVAPLGAKKKGLELPIMTLFFFPAFWCTILLAKKNEGC